MKKEKIISLIMALATVFSVSAPVYAVETEAHDYSAMPISEVYNDYSTSLIAEDDIMLISPKPNNTADTITVLLNDEILDFTDENGNKVNPQLINDRTMVPLRKIFEALGVKIEWDGTTETVTATTEEKTIKLQINNFVATVITGNKTEEIKLDAAPVVIEGRTLVPVRFISETLGLKVGWEQETQKVIIFDPSIVLEIIKDEAPTFYAMLIDETASAETGEVEFDATATLNYIDAMDKSNNSNVKMLLNGLVKIAEKAVGMNFDYKITGKGVIYNEMKAEGLDNTSMETIIDMENGDVYVKSPMLENGDKWLKEKYENPEELKEVTSVEDLSENPEKTLESIVSAMFDTVEITPLTYNDAKMLATMACLFLNDDYFSVSGRDTKMYKYEITIEDIEKILEEIGMDLGLDEIFTNTKLTFTSKYSNGVSEEATLKITAKIQIDHETLDINVDSKAVASKVNEKVIVEIPDAKDVVIAE